MRQKLYPPVAKPDNKSADSKSVSQKHVAVKVVTRAQAKQAIEERVSNLDKDCVGAVSKPVSQAQYAGNSNTVAGKPSVGVPEAKRKLVMVVAYLIILVLLIRNLHWGKTLVQYPV